MNPCGDAYADLHTMERLARFVEERIPERAVFNKGAGAYGYFEADGGLSRYTDAPFLAEAGKKTEVFARFSLMSSEKGSPDTERDLRGFDVRFYTDAGNYDMSGSNSPVFFIRDAAALPELIHTQKTDRKTGLKDPAAYWDFLSRLPESIHQTTILFTDRGTPDGYRHSHGYSSSAYMLYNEKGEYVWFKWHFIADSGFKTLTAKEAAEISAKDPDYAARDLRRAISKGEFPSWTVYAQIMTPEQAASYPFDPFDVTKVWYKRDCPLIRAGKMTLERNPDDYFAEVELAAFSPSSLVPGIYFSPDKLLRGRVYVSESANRYRLGPEYYLIPVNSSKGGAGAEHEIPCCAGQAPGRREKDPPEADFIQAGELYRRVLPDLGRIHLVSNIVGNLGGTPQNIQYRQAALFYKVDEDYGAKVCVGLGLDLHTVKALAAMPQDERIENTL